MAIVSAGEPYDRLHHQLRETNSLGCYIFQVVRPYFQDTLLSRMR